LAQIEKTVFISYRRTDVYTTLAVYKNLKNQGYDVFFDYRSISRGDFEATSTAFRERYLNIVRETARTYFWPYQRDAITIVPAALGDLSQAIGAALTALYKSRV
jgi:hypothetical protein